MTNGTLNIAELLVAMQKQQERLQEMTSKANGMSQSMEGALRGLERAKSPDTVLQDKLDALQAKVDSILERLDKA